MIYPAKPAKGFPQGSGEESLYKELAGLPDSYTTFYSLQLKTPEGPLREIDFLVIGPSGIFLIELKNGLYRRKENRLYLVKHNREEIEADGPGKRGPLEQLLSAKDRLLEFLSGCGLPEKLDPSAIAPLLIFLRKENESVFSERLEKEHSIFASDLQKSSILDLLAKRSIRLDQPADTNHRRGDSDKPSGLNEQIVKAILDRTNFIRGFRHRKKLQHDEAVSLTRNQYTVLLSAGESSRSLISGVAGSGKTLVLLELARRAAAKEKEILFLCHNSALNAHLELELSGFSGITVHRMVGFCLEVIRTFDPEFGKRKGGEDDEVRSQLDAEQREGETSKYLRETLPTLALEYVDRFLSETRQGNRFDLLIVDEAQDILSETELLLLDSLVEGGLDLGNWMFAYDGEQSLSGDIAAGLAYLRTRKPDDFFLDTNIRTPASSYRLARALTGLGGEGTLRDVIPPQIVYYTDEQSAFSGLIRILRFATEELKYNPEDILILGPGVKKYTVAPGSKLKAGEWRIRLVKKGDVLPGHVGYAEIKRFKGLEAPYVILTGLEGMNTSTDRSLLYVAMTRATGGLALLLPEKMRPWVERVWKG